MWDLIVSVPDHCLSFYFKSKQNSLENRTFPFCVKETMYIRRTYNLLKIF